MKTKPAEPIPTAFPTCGEVFHYLVQALDLTAWADMFHEDPRTKSREPADLKQLSDQLRDWATEADGRAPSRAELQDFIRAQLNGLPKKEDLASVLGKLWDRVLEEHASQVRENATWLDREGTRSWCARWRAPGTLYFLWSLQKLLRRFADQAGPVLDAPLNQLLARAWPDATGADARVMHPLRLACYQHYAELRCDKDASVDDRTVSAWEAGEDRPSFGALGRHFAKFPDKLGLLLNFAFAGLIEALADTLRASVSNEEWAECRRLILGQAGCLHTYIDEDVAGELARIPDMSLPDYERLLEDGLRHHVQFLARLPRSGPDTLDLRIAPFRCYPEYERRFVVAPEPNFVNFYHRLKRLCDATKPDAPSFNASAVAAELAKLRSEYPHWSEALAGPLLAIEARMALRHAPPTAESIQQALKLYQRAFAESRYRAGAFTVAGAREALGVAAMLHRREIGEGAIKPWIKKVLAWWDLLGLGTEFDHEQLEQRIELAESEFTNRLHPKLRDGLKAALPQLGLTHFRVGGLFGFTEDGGIAELEKTPVDPRQKRPMSATIVGRDQSPLMEAIDRGQLNDAHDLVARGADLNFINSTGDTCVTKAFARGDYDLVLKILQRDEKPITRTTLLRVTNQNQHSPLERALWHGRVEILRELGKWKQGRGDVIDMSRERIAGKTPLYHTVELLAWLGQMSKEVRLAPDPTHNPDGLLACIRYLISEAKVDLDTPNINNHSALTFAAENGLQDVAEELLKAGANVNHPSKGGTTALAWAIWKNNYPLAKLLLEFNADYRLRLERIGRPIYLLPMSEQMRRLIPDRL